MTIIAALASFGASAAGLVGLGTGVVAGTTGTAAITAAGASAAALGTGASAAIGAGTGAALGAGAGAIQAAATGQDVGEGALIGAGTGLAAAGVGSGVAAGAKAAGLAGTIGTTATNAAVGGTTGAVVGAGKSAATGQDVGKGALVGGASGAVAAGAMGAIGPAEVGSASPNIEGAAVPKTSLDSLVPQPTSSVALPNSPAPNTSVNALGDIAPPSTTLTANPSYSGDQISTGLTGLAGAAGIQYTGNQMIDAQAAASKAASEDAARAGTFANQNQAGMNRVQGLGLGSSSGPLSALGSIGRATGGLTALAHGGQVPLKDGAYIIPADVVSALGNGSSKAGAEFLRHLMMEVRKESVNIQGLGAAKKHVA
jgi:hypothetical protein